MLKVLWREAHPVSGFSMDWEGHCKGDPSGTVLTETSRRREGFEMHDLKHNDRKNMFGNVKFQFYWFCLNFQNVLFHSEAANLSLLTGFLLLLHPQPAYPL